MIQAPQRPGVALPLAVALALWFLMFSPLTAPTRWLHDHAFWPAMSGSAGLLAIWAMRAQRGEWKSRILRVEPKLVALGLVHAVGLYALSRLGVFLMLTLFGNPVADYLRQIYSTRTQLPLWVVGTLLALLIAPAEEIFWRGWVQDHFQRTRGATQGWILTSLIYCGVHVSALNPPLLLAALVLGVHWGYLYRRTESLVPGLVSHLIWDVSIFALFPVEIIQ
jgi:membrane protease YdiL (CAAX protease family)